MLWWRKLRRRTRESAEIRREFPVTLELVPQNLSARVYLHEADSPKGPISCWSYVTDGMSTHGQKELIFTLRRMQKEGPDQFPEEPLILLRSLHKLAEEGQTFGVGGFTRLAGPVLFGYHGVAYIRP